MDPDRKCSPFIHKIAGWQVPVKLWSFKLLWFTESSSNSYSVTPFDRMTEHNSLKLRYVSSFESESTEMPPARRDGQRLLNQ